MLCRCLFSGYLYCDFTSVPVCPVQRLYDVLCLFLFHFEEREIFHQVDASQFYSSSCVIVEQGDQFVREEVIHLTQIDEKAGVTRFCLAAAFSFTAFSGAFAAAIGRHLYFFAVAIIVDKPVELMRYHALDEVFFTQPLQFTVNLRHEIIDILLVYLYFFKIVYHFEKLFLADLLTGRHFTGNEFLTDDAFYFAHLSFFTQIDDGDGCTCLSGTSCTSATVRITFRIVRQSVVDDVCQVVYVQSARGYIGGYQNLDVADAELLHHRVTLCL